ncbi:MAG: DDE-type integrase/transposase/recombinase [Kiloniellaceae bacterium]
MSARWHRPEDLLGLPGMPAKAVRSIYLRAAKHGWRSRGPRGAYELLEDDLPDSTRRALSARRRSCQHPSGVALPARDSVQGGDAPDPTPGRHPERRCLSDDPESAAASPPPAAAGGSAAGDVWPPSPAASPLSAPISGPRAARIEAWVHVLRAAEDWRSARGLPVGEADDTFAAAYNAGRIETPAAARAELPHVTPRSLRRSRKRLRQGGIAALSDGRATARRRAESSFDEYLAAIVYEYPHLSAARILAGFKARHPDDRAPSLRAVQRRLAQFKAENARALSAVTDPDRHRSRRQPAFGDAGESIVRLNQLWELDSTPADVICTDGRQVVVGAIDVYSRRLRMLVAPTSRATAIAALLRRCLIEWGVPEDVRTDEGRDYTSIHITRVLADLDITHHRCRPYTPETKPFIERALGTLTRELFETLPGYAGHTVAEAQRLRARKAFAARRGEGDREAFRVALSAGELQAALDAWTDNVYLHAPRGGLGGKTPFQMITEWRDPVRRIENHHALDVLLAEAPGGHGIRTVGKHGIQVEGTWFIAAELGALVGERVHVRLDPDMGRVRVFDVFGERFICDAVAPERAGLDRRAIAIEARARAKAADKAARAEARRLRREHRPEALADELAAAAAAKAKRVVPFPGPSRPHESAGLAAAAEAVQADVENDFDFGSPTVVDDLTARRRAAARAAEAAELDEGGRLIAEMEDRAPAENRARLIGKRSWET